MEVIVLFVIYFLIHFFLTQRIYANNRFLLLLLISAMIPAVLYFFLPGQNKIAITILSCMFLFYAIILWLIKRYYKNVNEFFIRRKLLSAVFLKKDFTYVMKDIHINRSSLDKKQSTTPSWLDDLLSFILFAVPIISPALFV